jgi:hypothetical protein
VYDAQFSVPDKMSIKHRTPYENIVIGNFLYGMGLSLGSRAGHAAPLASINNIQQTPLDPKLADVWVTFPGVCRLLEFKRNDVSKESKQKDVDKRDALAIGLVANPELLAVSRRVHAFVEVAGSATQGIDVRLTPFIDFDQVNAERLTLAQYIDRFTKEALEPSPAEPSREEVSRYLKLVAQLAKDGDASTGGLMVHVTEDGVLHYIPLADIRDLDMQYGLQLQRELAATMEIEKERDLAAELKLEPTHEHSRGHGMGR